MSDLQLERAGSALREEVQPDTAWDAELGSIEIRFGAGRLAEAGAIVAGHGWRHVLLVCDQGIADAGHLERARRSLEAAGVAVDVCTDVHENPSCALVARGARHWADRDLDGLVALGGGSTLDTAKGINFLLTNGGGMEDYWGYAKTERPLLPAIGIPTTAGTGSEAQTYALISADPDAEGYERKMACGDPTARFRTVVLDPELLATAPRDVAARAAIDAVSHAVETQVTSRRNPISSTLAREAWRRLDGAFEGSLERPDDLAAQGEMLLGAHLAGAAIEASMLGAAHATANPLTAAYGVHHGTAVGLMLPSVVRFNGAVVDELYRELVPAGTEALALRIEEQRAAAGLPGSLADYGIGPERFPELARRAAEEWTGTFNPRPLELSDLVEIYAAAA